MKAEELVALPSRPDSEVEWEDLLLRLELMPRALRVALESAAEECSPDVIRDLVRREGVVNRHLERAAVGVEAEAPGGTMELAEALLAAANIEESVDRFVRLRNRNFAMLQRRGINVWDWTVEVESAAPASVFQLMTLLARKDVELLGLLRNGRAPARPAC